MNEIRSLSKKINKLYKATEDKFFSIDENGDLFLTINQKKRYAGFIHKVPMLHFMFYDDHSYLNDLFFKRTMNYERILNMYQHLLLHEKYISHGPSKLSDVLAYVFYFSHNKLYSDFSFNCHGESISFSLSENDQENRRLLDILFFEKYYKPVINKPYSTYTEHDFSIIQMYYS